MLHCCTELQLSFSAGASSSIDTVALAATYDMPDKAGAEFAV
jgi:hypothetical protein